VLSAEEFNFRLPFSKLPRQSDLAFGLKLPVIIQRQFNAYRTRQTLRSGNSRDA
jgi:hypothetical protein